VTKNFKEYWQKLNETHSSRQVHTITIRQQLNHADYFNASVDWPAKL